MKIVQITYSFYQNGGRNPEAAQKELLLSLGKAYDMYNYLLMLLVEVGRMALRTAEVRQNRAKRLGEDANAVSMKFVNNKFLLQLESNKMLSKFQNVSGYSWADHEDFVRSLYAKVEESAFFKQYVENDDDSYEADKEVCRLIYRHFVCNNEELDSILEEACLYWNDDKVIVDTFVLKTINRFQADSAADQPLLPEYKDLSDKEFAEHLLARTLGNGKYYYDLIASTTRKWDVKRVALMDRVILQVALAEIISFPGIPLSVSINEYVELAKMYSTPKSGKYINATLDNIAKKLLSENKLIKDDQTVKTKLNTNSL